MAKEIAKAQVYLDGKQAEAAIDGLKKKSKELRDALSQAVKAGDHESITKLKKELKGVDAATRSLKKETFDYKSVLKNINGAAYNELTKSLKTMQAQYRKLKPVTEEDIRNRKLLAKNIQLVRTKQRELNDEQRASIPLMGKLSNGFNKYFGMATAGIAAITGAVFSASQFVKGLVGLDDALANVQKTTGLARDEVRSMYTEFEKLNTRTKKSVLLEYAEEAGRLGKKGKADIMGFVEQANKIGTALGDDLGDTKAAINTIGKLVGMYKVGTQYGVDFNEGMNKIGSAINEIAANSAAAAPYQVDYLKRMSGTAKQAKITADEILGYSSVLDQNGQAVEMAATAQGKLMIDMFTEPAKYAEIAGMKIGDFTKLLNTDANEAFLKLLDGLDGNDQGLMMMASRFKELGVSGARAVQVISTLASNTEAIRDQQKLANDAMREGVSLTEEYNIKNDNLAGSWEKLTRAVRSKFINSSAIEMMEKLVGSAARMVEIPLSKTLSEQKEEVNLLTVKLQSANLAEGEREKILTRINELAPKVAESLKGEQTSIEDVTEALAMYNDEMSLKVLIAEGDEDIAKQKTKVEAYKKLAIEAQADMASEMAESLDWFNKKAPEVKETAESILYDTQLSLQQKALKLHNLSMEHSAMGINSLFTSLDSFKSYNAAYANEMNAMNKMVAGAKDNKEEWEKIFGIESSAGPVTVTPEEEPSRPTNTFVPLSSNAPKAAKKLEIKDQDLTAEFDLETEKEFDKELKAESEQGNKLLQQYETYLQARKRIKEQYATDSFDLGVAGGTDEQQQVLKDKEAAELMDLDTAFGEKQAGFEAWADSMLNVGLDQLQATLAKASTMLINESGKASINGNGDAQKRTAELQAKIKVLNAQIKALETAQETDNADSSTKKWGNTLEAMQDVQQTVGGIVEGFGELDEVTTAALSAAENISGGIISMLVGIQTLAITGKKAVEGVERASVILAVISAAIQVLQKMNDLLVVVMEQKSNALKEKINGINKMTDAVRQYELAVLNAKIADENWFGDDDLKHLTNLKEKQLAVQKAYFDKLKQQQLEYENEGAGGFLNSTMGKLTVGGPIGYARAYKDIMESQEAGNTVSARDNLNIETRASTKGVLGIGAKSQKTENLEDYVKNNLGIDLFDEDGWLNDEAYQTVLDNYGDKLVGQTAETLEQLAELKEQNDEYLEELHSYVNDMYSPLVDDFSNGIWDSIVDDGVDAFDAIQDYAAETFQNIMKDMLNTMVMERVFEGFGDDINDMYEQYSDGKLTEDQLMSQVANRTKELNEKAKTEIPVLQDMMTTLTDNFTDTTGIDVTGQDELQAQSATSAAIRSVTQEQAGVIEGRMTGLQSGLEVVKLETIKFGMVMLEMKGLVLNIYGLVEEIRDNTDALPLMLEKLEKIEKNTSNF